MGKEESCAKTVNQAKTVAVIHQALPSAGSYGYKECPPPPSQMQTSVTAFWRWLLKPAVHPRHVCRFISYWTWSIIIKKDAHFSQHTRYIIVWEPTLAWKVPTYLSDSTYARLAENLNAPMPHAISTKTRSSPIEPPLTQCSRLIVDLPLWCSASSLFFIANQCLLVAKNWWCNLRNIPYLLFWILIYLAVSFLSCGMRA